MQIADNRLKGRRSAESKESSQSLRRALGYLFRYPKVVVGATIALLVATSAQLAVPQLIQNIIDTVVNSAGTEAIISLPEQVQTVMTDQLGLDLESMELDLDNAPRALVMAGITIVVFALARGLFSFAQAYLSQVLSQNIAFDLRNDIFSKIQRLSFSYHDRNRTGQLMIRATDDVERLRLFIGQGLLMALQAFLLLIGTLIILMLTNFRLTLIILPVLPIALVIFMVFGRVAQPLFREVQQRLASVNTLLQENLAGLRVVKSFAKEPAEEERFGDRLDDLLEQRLVIARIFSFLFPFIFLVANLGQAAILYFGGRAIIEGNLTLGEWQKFSLYLVYIFIPMGQLGFIISLMAQASASADRIFEILDAENRVQDKPNAITISEINGYVKFENVSFQYFNSGDPVLQEINFVAKPGQTIALLGSTGSGKTTIINLIPRFYDATEGRILIDEIDVRDATLVSLRQKIGIVLQETTLFTGTIRDNIAFGRSSATDDEIISAAKAASAHDFITGFPGGYETRVGERGSTLSGGQKQRIAIARALIMDPHILILDDSTSSVDLNTEYQIQKALDLLMEGRTSFVIAQRISTVVNADQILILDKGRITAVGTHEQLMNDSPIYADIYHSQLLEDAIPI